MKKTELIAAFIAERSKWKSTINLILPDQFKIVINQDGWTIKGIISHCTWFEVEMANLIKPKSLNGSDLWLLSTDERNRAIYNLHKEDNFSKVLATARSMKAVLLNLFDSLSEKDLQDASNFNNMPLDWVPRKLIAENTFEHYKKHISTIHNALHY
jgi:hypothetical protein